jgi:hypothetical protein
MEKYQDKIKTLFEKRGNMNSMAVVRANDVARVRTTLCDLVRYGHMTFADHARKLEPTFADNILVQIMKSPLKACCLAAKIVALEDPPSKAIDSIRKIHPPAHVIILSPRHEIYHELINYVDILPEIDLTLESGAEPETVNKLSFQL